MIKDFLKYARTEIDNVHSNTIFLGNKFCR